MFSKTVYEYKYEISLQISYLQSLQKGFPIVLEKETAAPLRVVNVSIGTHVHWSCVSHLEGAGFGSLGVL